MIGRNRRTARRTSRRTSRRTTRRVVRRTALLPGRSFRRRNILFNGFSLLLVGGAAYKIGQAQAQQIQQYTGRPPEDLSPDELENAMGALNIEPQELNDQDKAAIEAEAVDNVPATPTAPAATYTAPGTAVSNSPTAKPAQDYIAEIQNLAGLRDMGIITDEEFVAKKKQLLGL